MADKRQLALRRQQGAAADIREERLGRRGLGEEAEEEAVGEAEEEAEGEAEGEAVGETEGEAEGEAVGEAEEEAVGEAETIACCMGIRGRRERRICSRRSGLWA